jgi:putative membrane protein
MNSYLLFKSLHLISVISWMAGLLYLPRIFVYHSENFKNFDMTSIFKTMERKLYYYIMMPAMFLSWFFGLILISIIGFENLSLGWLKLKLIFVILLTIYHFYLGKILNEFKLDLNKNSSKFFRWINEIPTILLILIVFIVIFKPIFG